MGFLARDTLVKACTSFMSIIEALFTADGSFIEYVDCRCVSLLIFFYFNKIGWFSAVLCHLKESRKKFRIYRCHPVHFIGSQVNLHFRNKDYFTFLWLKYFKLCFSYMFQIKRDVKIRGIVIGNTITLQKDAFICIVSVLFLIQYMSEGFCSWEMLSLYTKFNNERVFHKTGKQLR